MTNAAIRFLVNTLLVAAICVLLVTCCYEGYVAMGTELAAREFTASDRDRVHPDALDVPRIGGRP